MTDNECVASTTKWMILENIVILVCACTMSYLVGPAFMLLLLCVNVGVSTKLIKKAENTEKTDKS